MSVRMSEVQHSPSDDEMSPVGSVTSLRQRFEMIGQGANGTTDRPLSPQRRGLPDRPLSPQRRGPPDRPLSPQRRGPPDRPLSPQRRTPPDRPLSPQRRGPPRPPPPVPKERRLSDTPSSPESPTTPKSPSRHAHHGTRQVKSHPLEKSKSKSVEELEATPAESEASEEATDEGGGGKKKGGKKEKNKKQKSKEGADGESSGKGKFNWLKGHKSSSTETKESPKASPEHSSKSSKKATAAVDQSSSELSSSKGEASVKSATTEESGEKESAKLSGRKSSAEVSGKGASAVASGKKRSPELGGKKTPSESKNQKGSPERRGKKEPAEASAKVPETSGHQKVSDKKYLKKSESARVEGFASKDQEDSGDSGKRTSSGLKKSKSHIGSGSAHSASGGDMASRVRGGGRERGAGLNVKEEAKHAREAVLQAEEKELTAAKLEPILRKELACLTGGLEGDNHQIVAVTENGLKMMETPSGFEDFKTTLAYFRALMNPQHISTGATLIIDARSTTAHKAAKHLLERLSDDTVPLPLHMIYLLIKTSIFSFGRNKSLVSGEAASRLHLAYLHDAKQVVDQLGGENVMREMGGTLGYSHEEWLQHRLQYERMVHLHKKTLQRLPETKNALDHFDIPTTVKDAENLMQEDLALKEKMINLFAESELKMDQFVTSLKEQQEKERKSDVEVMMSSVEDMMAEIKGRQTEFDQFWKLHRARVEHMMSMCHFSRSTEKMKKIMQGHIEDMAEDKVVLGDTLESALEQGEKHELFAVKCMETMDEQMNRIRSDAANLCSPPGLEATAHSATQKAVEVVRSQLKELTRTYEQLVTTCQQKRDMYIVCVKFHMKTRQVQQWNEEVLELLASQPLDQPTPSTALSLTSQIDQWLMQMPPSEVANLRELSSSLPGKGFKKKYDIITRKYENTRGLLEQRRTHLQRILSAHFPNPVAPPSPQLHQKVPASQVSHNGHNEVDLPPDRVSISSVDSAGGDYTDTESDPGVLKNRQFVFKELMATEQDYIKDLSTVIDSYYDEMDPESLSIPLRLRGKRDIVFGNLLDIKKFHEELFSKALEKYADSPERIGECFTQHSVQFQMYSLYCKNRTNSETLINESTESQAFFKGIQLKLGHALHLNSYLLKPIQRITKYQLLLKDMMKNAMSAKRAHSDLKLALESMLKVLKNLNDSLHVVGLKGFPGSLAEQGRLLVHDPFQVSDTTGRFSRSKERHVFLFEKVVILSKRIEAPVQKRERKSDAYIYKDHIAMAEVGLREMMDRHGVQFQIIIHGQNKMYLFQANTREVKEMWVTELRRLLQAQFMLMKDVVFKSGTLDRSNYKGKARPALNRDSRLFGDSFKAPAHGTNPKKSLAGRFFNIKKGKRGDSRSKKSSSAIDPSASLPAGVGHAIRPSQSLMPYSMQDDFRMSDSPSVSEDTKSDSISSDEEIAFSSDEEDGLDTAAVDHYESLAPGAPRYYTATADYDPGSTENGVKLSNGQEVEVIGINKYGWWWVRSTNHYTSEVEEGWVPASYLHVSPAQMLPGVMSEMAARFSGLHSKN